ncbi:MAG: hypothetical protein FWD64_09515, partial [Acidobacteriaceae bacterium]|nr:hypothetical protein [Acidobacteriaceae bacterium]
SLSLALIAVSGVFASAAQLSNDARESIPRDVQQIIVVDYRSMQNSSAAMELKDKVLPPEVKRLEEALTSSGLKVDHDTDALAFASYRLGDQSRIVGIAQGQFQTKDIMAYFAKNKIKPVKLRNSDIYPMGKNGMSVVFLDQTTMVFADKEALQDAMDARDGLIPNFLANSDMMNEMASVDQQTVWSLLDQKGTQTMMSGVLGSAAQIADYDTVRDRMKSSRYTMDFKNGVKFEMNVVMSDTMTAALAATAMKGVTLLRKAQGSVDEKSALNSTTIDSSAGTLRVSYSASDSQFSSLLSSDLFKSVVK